MAFAHGFKPQRGGGIAGSLNEAQWLLAPTGRKVIAQGKAKRRPGIRCVLNSPSPERAKPAVRQSMRTCSALSGLWRIGAAAYLGRSRTTQGGASLYPGLSHFAPLGRTIRLRIGFDCTLQAIQVMVDYSGWRLHDGFMPQRGARDCGFIERSPIVLCPNGAKGDSPGQSEAPPWDPVCPKKPKP
jgi:hypothetical protein